MSRPSLAPRIIALGMLGLTAFAISRRVGCSEEHANRVLGLWRAEGGAPVVQPQRRPPRRVLA